MDKTDATLKALEKQIKATYTKAYQEMKKEMTDILSKIEINPEMSLAQKMALMTKYDRLNTLSTQLANTAYNANTMAQKMINNEMVNVYDINYNGDAERLGFGLIDHTAIKKVLKQEENPFNMISSLRDKEGIRNQMKGQLLSGLLKGESIPKIARRLKDVSEKSLKDCIRIARTETTRVQNSAKMDIGKEGQRLGFEMWKRWVATTDGRVREDHLAMNGVEVPQDEPFVLPDGSKMMFPADISLGADVSQVVNCRCTMIEFRKETQKEDFSKEEKDAIKGWSAKGGQYESKYHFNAEDRKILDKMANENTEESVGLFSKIDMTEGEINKLFDRWYNGDEVEVSFNRFQPFTENYTRSLTFGGKTGESIVYEIPQGIKINAINISKESIYPEELEHLVGTKNKFVIKDFTFKGSRRIVVLGLKE